MHDDSPMYSEGRNRTSGRAGASLILTLLFILIIGIGGTMGWLYMKTQSLLAESDTRFIRIEQNLVIIKEALKITDENFSDIEQERRERVQVLESEIKKLWSLANVRNKKAIAQVEKDVISTNSRLGKIHGDGQKQQETIDQLGEGVSGIAEEINKLSENQKSLDGKLADIGDNKSLKASLDKFDRRLGSIESQRSANNTRLVQIQDDMNLLRSRLLSLESSFSLPSKNLIDNPGTP